MPLPSSSTWGFLVCRSLLPYRKKSCEKPPTAIKFVVACVKPTDKKRRAFWRAFLGGRRGFSGSGAVLRSPPSQLCATRCVIYLTDFNGNAAIPFRRTDSPVSRADLAVLSPFLPLYTDLLSICYRGAAQTWHPKRPVVSFESAAPVPSMGRVGI